MTTSTASLTQRQLRCAESATPQTRLTAGDQMLLSELQLRRAHGLAPQPRPNVADQLERLTPRFDSLVHRARLAISQSDIDDVDELIHLFCRDLRAAVRAPTPRNPPLRQTAEGCLW